MDAASPSAEPIGHASRDGVPVGGRGLEPSAATPRSTRIGAPRWTALVAATCIGLTALAIGSSRPVHVAVPASLGPVTATTITHLGLTSPATDGSDLVSGDVVTVGADGTATIRLGAGEARLAPGTTLQIDELDERGVVLEQLGGRVYHRIAPGSGPYVIRTGSIEWTALGSAFDLDREPVGESTLERVTGTPIEGSVLLEGPGLDGTVVEGRQAVVGIGVENPDVATAEVPAGWLADPWVVENAGRDRAAGAALGILARRDRAATVAPGP